MEQKEINNLTRMATALCELGDAWYNVKELWSDYEVTRAMDDNKVSYDLYPFDRSFDEMCPEVEEWTYQVSRQLQKRVLIEEYWNKICTTDLSYEEIEEVIETLHERLKKDNA